MATEHIAHNGVNLPLDEGLSLNRRRWLQGAFTAVASSVTLPTWAQGNAAAAGDEFWIRPRWIRLTHPSGDRINALYWSDGEIVLDGYRELSWFMRDRVVNEAVYMHPVLLDITYGVCGWCQYFGVREDPILTSGKRNAIRNQHIEGAVKDSLHITGEAIDMRFRGINSLQVAQFGVWLGGGGVGWYPRKDFTHLDRGRLRTWRG